MSADASQIRLELLGISYRPALADLPDQKGWRRAFPTASPEHGRRLGGA
jgi:hypothetical protein